MLPLVIHTTSSKFMPYGFNSDADDDDVNVNTCNKILTSKGHPKWYIEQISHCVSFIVMYNTYEYAECYIYLIDIT